MPSNPDTAAARRSAYEPAEVEAKWYRYWEEGGFFRAEVDPAKKPFVIMMPPPNVTGRLHMGHALQSTVQDVLTRMKRMQGFEALWLPGIDHAGIATQNVVARQLREEGSSRETIGREAFVEKVWAWKAEYGDIIYDQKRRLGVSCDWSRTRFTMDDGFSRAVGLVFKQLYDEGLIYRGSYLVNWCPVDQTALSDEEVDNVERNGSLWYIRYPVVGSDELVVVATTRPETMFGDVAVAVHPDDKRYAHLVGKLVQLPLTDRQIPVIADEYVKSDFGAGALKVTPGHDRNDFEIAGRHKLPVISIMNPDGTLSPDAGGEFAGLDRFVARDLAVKRMTESGLVEKVEEYRGTVPISSRSGAVIEPLISRQWFVRMKPLAEPALEAVRNGDIRFFPKRWENEYYRWMENIRDWTISRQLWWGHRIPVWYHVDETGAIDESRDFVVSVDEPESGEGNTRMVQDEDVLDTWFSSWLWPFGTLGWPEKSADLDYFYPTNVLVSGYDILFFWIARMIMAGRHFTGQNPFADIFITGMVKDKQGRWMSKSLGNGIDPLDMIDQYGADAVRFSLTVLCAQGQDIKLDPLKFEMGRNFANKLWNAYNVFGQFMSDSDAPARTVQARDLTLVERWMLHRLNTTITAVTEAGERYRLNEAVLAIYDLFWRDYCDWYLELIKPDKRLDEGGTMSPETIALAADLYERMLLLLHPFMPFITEEVWWRIRERQDGDSVMNAPWPVVVDAELDPEAEALFGLMQRLIQEVRNIRSQYNVKPSQGVAVVISLAPGGSDGESRGGSTLGDQLREHEAYFRKLAGINSLTVGEGLSAPPASASAVVGDVQVFVPLAGMIDLDVERARLAKEIKQKEAFVLSLRKKLRNSQFVDRAPADVVARERVKEQTASDELERLRAGLEELDGR